MKNGTQKRIKIHLEDLGENINHERLFRALRLILSEEDLAEYLSTNRTMKCCCNFRHTKKSEAFTENLANS
jgi:hypothetical protein